MMITMERATSCGTIGVAPQRDGGIRWPEFTSSAMGSARSDVSSSMLGTRTLMETENPGIPVSDPAYTNTSESIFSQSDANPDEWGLFDQADHEVAEDDYEIPDVLDRHTDVEGQEICLDGEGPSDAAAGAGIAAAKDSGSSCPQLQVFFLEDIAKLESSAKGKDRETANRILDAVKRLKEQSPIKPLATIPVGWREELAKFKALFPNFSEFIDDLEGYFAIAEINKRGLSIPHTMFAGDPGVGKTEAIHKLSSIINTELIRIDMSSAQTGAPLSGSDTFWANSREGRVFEALAWGRTANPILFLDELDKINDGDHYRPDGALYGLLESTTAKSFKDLSLPEISLDASRVIWFAATNEPDRVSAPIRSRFNIYHIRKPTIEESISIAQSIYRKIIEDQSLHGVMSPEISVAIAECVADSPPREMRKALLKACARAVMNGRNEIVQDDVPTKVPPKRRGMGFVL